MANSTIDTDIIQDGQLVRSVVVQEGTVLKSGGKIDTKSLVQTSDGAQLCDNVYIVGGGGGGGSSLPSQEGHSGEFLTTNGTEASWATVDALPSQSGQSGKFLTTDGTNASWGEVPLPQNVWTQDNLVAGDNVSITQQSAGSGNDEYTAGLFHFDGDCVNSGLQTLYTNTFPQSGEVFDNDGKFGQCLYNNVSSVTSKIFLTSTETISSDNFTLDFWYKPYSFGNNKRLWFRIFDTDVNSSTNTPGFCFSGSYSSNSSCGCCGSSGDNLYSVSVDFGVWTHFAVEIYNGTTYYYKNGTKIYQAVNTTINKTKMGSFYSEPGAQLYVDEVRFSTTARYQGQNFTPPTQPYSGGGPAIYQINAVLPTTIDGGNADA